VVPAAFRLASGGNGFFILLFFPVLFAAVRVGLLQSVGMATTCAVAGVILSTHAANQIGCELLRCRRRCWCWGQ
jgi:hypothetical protein